MEFLSDPFQGSFEGAELRLGRGASHWTRGSAMLIAGQCTPHFSFGLANRETGRARSKEKKRFGGSVSARADLLPPAGDGWRSRAAVRDGNALILGKPSARGSLGYTLRRFSLPLASG